MGSQRAPSSPWELPPDPGCSGHDRTCRPAPHEAPLVQQLCHIWVAAFPHRLKGIFVSSIFLLKLQVTTLSFSKHSPLFCKSGSALPRFYSNVFPPSSPRSEKLTILMKHTHWFFLFHTASFSHFESQITSGMSPTRCSSMTFTKTSLERQRFGNL